MMSSSPSNMFLILAVVAFSIICCKQQQNEGFAGCYLLPVAVAAAAATPQTPDINVSRRKALLVETLRQAQIEDPEEILVPHHQSSSSSNLLLGKALHDTILSDPDSSIDLLSICRLQCRIEFIQQQQQQQQDDDNDGNNNNNIDNQLKDLQSECVTEMFELTQKTGINPPNITIAFGSDIKAKNTDFINWCYRLLTSNYYIDNNDNLESLRTQMILYNPYWKAAVKATYLQKIMTKMTNNNNNNREQQFDEIIQDPKLWADAIRYLASLP